MVTCYKSLLALFALAVCLTIGEAFFLNWGTPEPQTSLMNWAPPIKAQPWTGTQAYVYQQRLLQQPPPAPHQYSNELESAQQPLPMPAIPIQVPLSAQLTPAANIHNVQLVPCLCPISQAEMDSAHEIYSSNKNQQN